MFLDIMALKEDKESIRKSMVKYLILKEGTLLLNYWQALKNGNSQKPYSAVLILLRFQLDILP